MKAKRTRRRAAVLAVPEEVVTQLIDAEQFADDDDPEIDAALAKQVDLAAGEVAKALAGTGGSLAHLHALRRAAEEIGCRRGYRTGALLAGWLLHALADDAPKRRQPRR